MRDIGAIAYTHSRRLDRSRDSRCGWASSAPYIMGSPTVTVILWRSMAASIAPGSKPRRMTFVPPTASADISTVCCPQ
ncbi:hypothetical protein D9M68_619900 [compost metagenome]